MSIILNDIALVLYALIIIAETKCVHEHVDEKHLNIRFGMMTAAVIATFASFIFTILK